MKRIKAKEPRDAPASPPGRDAPRTRWGQVRLRSLESLDGRTAAARIARDTVRALSHDLGDDLTTSQRLLAEHAALSAVMLQDLEAAWLSGKSINLSEFATLINALSRTLVRLGLERRARDITPDPLTYARQYEHADEAAE